MKKIQILFICILIFKPFSLWAESYVFSGGKNSLAQSISAVVLVNAYKKAGINIKPVFFDLQYSLQQSNAGITDGEIARVAKIVKFTPNLIQVPVPIASLDAVAFSKNTAIKINSWSDLAGYKVTIVSGVKFIEVATKKYKPTKTISFAKAAELLQTDKTDIVVTSKIAFVNMVHRKNYTDIKPVSGSLKHIELFHFVHKKNQHLIAKITPILQQMQDTGEIDHIRKSQLMNAAQQFPR